MRFSISFAPSSVLNALWQLSCLVLVKSGEGMLSLKIFKFDNIHIKHNWSRVNELVSEHDRVQPRQSGHQILAFNDSRLQTAELFCLEVAHT